jgi:hypothetical protein
MQETKKATALKKGDVILLPMGRTAEVLTIPKVGTTYVTFHTEYGTTRLQLNDEALIEKGSTMNTPIEFFNQVQVAEAIQARLGEAIESEYPGIPLDATSEIGGKVQSIEAYLTEVEGEFIQSDSAKDAALFRVRTDDGRRFRITVTEEA